MAVMDIHTTDLDVALPKTDLSGPGSRGTITVPQVRVQRPFRLTESLGLFISQSKRSRYLVRKLREPFWLYRTIGRRFQHPSVENQFGQVKRNPMKVFMGRP